MTKNLRDLLSISALALSVGLASSAAAFAQDKMGKDTMSNPTSKAGMKKDDAMSKAGMKKHDAMAKDGMSKDNMKKQRLSRQG